MLFGSLLACYVTLLRYNRASATNFNLRIKRHASQTGEEHGGKVFGAKRDKIRGALDIELPGPVKVRHVHSEHPHHTHAAHGHEGRTPGFSSLPVYVVEEHHEGRPSLAKDLV